MDKILDTEDNAKIIAEMLKFEIERAMKRKNPSAEELINEVDVLRRRL